MRLIGLMFALLLSACAPQVSRKQALETAYRYTQIRWTPETRHVRHGADSQGIVVRTPDHSINVQRGWWKPGEMAISMPYQWGGFDTPETFLRKIRMGYKAGDIGGPAKRKLGDAGVSAESCGIDCSGFVSRCWNLPRPYSTRELPEICQRIAWEELKPGDILLKDGHVILFAKWRVKNQDILGFEAGPFPRWDVHSCGLSVKSLIADGYAAWRYENIVDEKWEDRVPQLPKPRDFRLKSTF